MERIIAVKFNSMKVNDLKIFEKLKNYEFDELILYFNGTSSLYFNIEKNPYIDKFKEVTEMETEVELDLDKIYRQLISYVHQSRSEGMLFILDASDTIPDTQEWMYRAQVTGLLEKSYPEMSEEIKVNNVSDLFKLPHPLGIVPILDIKDSAKALQSRNLVQFISFFTKGWTYFDKNYIGNLAEILLIDNKYDIQLLDLSYYKDPVRRIIKYLTNKLEEYGKITDL